MTIIKDYNDPNHAPLELLYEIGAHYQKHDGRGDEALEEWKRMIRDYIYTAMQVTEEATIPPGWDDQFLVAYTDRSWIGKVYFPGKEVSQFGHSIESAHPEWQAMVWWLQNAPDLKQYHEMDTPDAWERRLGSGWQTLKGLMEEEAKEGSTYVKDYLAQREAVLAARREEFALWEWKEDTLAEEPPKDSPSFTDKLDDERGRDEDTPPFPPPY